MILTFQITKMQNFRGLSVFYSKEESECSKKDLRRNTPNIETAKGGDVMAEYPDFVEVCGYGDVQGIGGVNCR